MSLEIKKRGDTWTYVVDVGVDPSTGKRKRASKGGFKTKGECRTAASKIITEVENDTYYTLSGITVKDFLDRYLEAIKPNLAYKTYVTYKYLSDFYIAKNLGKIKIKDLKPMHIQDLYNKVQSEKSSTTVRHIHNFLHKALDTAIKWQLTKTNPSNSIEKPKRAKVEMNVLNETQLNSLLESLEKSSIYLICCIAAGTGMRVAEICGLKWLNIDINNKIIYVKNQLQRSETKTLDETKLKTNNSYRKVILPEKVVESLNLEKLIQDGNKEYFKDAYNKGDYVICQANGNPYDPAYISRNFNRITREYKHKIKIKNDQGDDEIKEMTLLEILDIPRIRFHDLRHTHATLLLKAGLSPKVVAERLGDTVATVMNTYAHVLPDMQKEAVEKLNDIFLKPDKE